MRRRHVLPLLLPASSPAPLLARERRPLHVEFQVSSGTQRSAWVHLIEQFHQQHPDIQVTNVELDPERYKREFEARVGSGKTDVAFWFAGERLRAAIRKGLVAPLDAPPLLAALAEGLSPGLLDASKYAGQPYAVPLSYYPWGFYYRKSLFARHKLTPPTTWPQFLALCEQLKSLGIPPTAVGAGEGWPAAAWFDYLSLRLNGLEAHRQILASDPHLTSAPARRVLQAWQGLLRRGYFLPATTDQAWTSVLPYLYRGEVGMVLMGAFTAARFPAAQRPDLGFFGFPLADLPAYEDSPLDVLILPAASSRRADAQRFLTFVAGSTVVNELARLSGQLSPRLDAPAPDDPLLVEGRKVLERASGLSFFFDRDARQDMVEPAFAVFKRLMTPPHDLP